MTVCNEQAPWALVEKKYTKLRGSVSASNTLAAKLAKTYKSSEAGCVEVSCLKEEVEREDRQKVICHKLVSQIREEAESRMVRFNLSLLGRSRVERLTSFLVTDFVNTVDAVLLQLDYDAVSRL